MSIGIHPSRHVWRIGMALPASLALMMAAFGTANAQTRTTEVDLELVLLANVSRSMSGAELELRRRDYAETLVSDDVFTAVQSGLLQTIALTYIDWDGTQEVIVDWQEVSTREGLEDFARKITVSFDEILRRVIDISGDGPINMGPVVTPERAKVLGRGSKINGLPLMVDDGWNTQFHLPDLDIYYRNCVIGGAGAFIIPVYGWPDFPDAVRRMLVLEIEDLAPPPGSYVLNHGCVTPAIAAWAKRSGRVL